MNRKGFIPISVVVVVIGLLVVAGGIWVWSNYDLLKLKMEYTKISRYPGATETESFDSAGGCGWSGECHSPRINRTYLTDDDLLKVKSHFDDYFSKNGWEAAPQNEYSKDTFYWQKDNFDLTLEMNQRYPGVYSVTLEFLQY